MLQLKLILNIIKIIFLRIALNSHYKWDSLSHTKLLSAK